MNPAHAYAAHAYETDIDAHNARVCLLHALSKQTPAKTWWDAEAWHPAVGRAMRIDRTAEGGVYALAPFRLAKVNEKHVILAAYPAPRILGPVDPDFLGIEQVLAWNPVDGSTEVLGDPVPQLFGAFTSTDVGTLYADTRDFFTAWAQERAAFYVRWCQSRRGEWAHGATETDLVPGALIIGKPEQIRWRPSTLPETLNCVGIDPTTINRAVLRAARLPRAVGTAQRIAA